AFFSGPPQPGAPEGRPTGPQAGDGECQGCAGRGRGPARRTTKAYRPTQVVGARLPAGVGAHPRPSLGPATVDVDAAQGDAEGSGERCLQPSRIRAGVQGAVP